MNSRGKSNGVSPMMFIVGILVVGGLVWGVSTGAIDLSGQGLAVTGTTQPVQVPTTAGGITCESSTSNTVTFTVFDSTPGNATQDLTGDYNANIYTKDSSGNLVKKVEQGASTTVALSPGREAVVYFEDIDGTHDVYGFVESFVADCATEQTVSVNKGVQDTTLTTVVYDVSQGTETANSSTASTTLAAGATAKTRIFVEASTANARWGSMANGGQVGIAIDYNSLVYKQPEITKVDNGTITLVGSAPNGHQNTAVVSTATSNVFYILNTDRLADLGSIEFDMQAEALTGTTNPDGSDGNIGITIYDIEQYENDNGVWVTGFRDADSAADLGETNATDTFHVV